MFLRRFLQRAREEGYIYYIMEAFDQPWKARYEGAVGAYWGVYNVDREPKFAFIEPIVRIPQWQTLAAISVVLASMVLALLYVHSRTLDARGRSLLAIVVYAVTAAAVWIIYDYSQQYITLRSVLIGGPLILGMFVVIAVLIAEAHEWAEAHWAMPRRRPFSIAAADAALPKVSIHVPAYNEPPQMLIETLDALARLDYPNYEVIVIDNNTKDEAAWRPVEQHCARLGRALPLLPRRSVARLQGRRAQLRARTLRAGRADRRRHRQRLPGRAGVAARSGAGLRRAEDRDRAGAAGLPRRRRERLQGHVLRGIPRLLPDRHDHAQRAQRDHPARHDDAGPARGARPGGRLGGVVHHRGRRARPAPVRARLRGAVPAAQLRPRPDARDVHRLQEAAVPLGVRRGADPASACARAVLARATSA